MKATGIRWIETPLGTLRGEAGPEGIRSLRWDPGSASVSPGTAPALDELEEQLAEYFRGERRSFDLPLAPEGTPFQRQVWEALGEIPYGETRTYGDLAERLGRPGAARAVGQANRSNPLPLVVPCHRVVARNGLGGYAGSGERGLRRKRALLELEGAST